MSSFCTPFRALIYYDRALGWCGRLQPAAAWKHSVGACQLHPRLVTVGAGSLPATSECVSTLLRAACPLRGNNQVLPCCCGQPAARPQQPLLRAACPHQPNQGVSALRPRQPNPSTLRLQPARTNRQCVHAAAGSFPGPAECFHAAAGSPPATTECFRAAAGSLPAPTEVCPCCCGQLHHRVSMLLRAAFPHQPSASMLLRAACPHQPI